MAKNELTTVEKFNLVTGMEEMDEELKAELEDELGDLDEENGIICRSRSQVVEEKHSRWNLMIQMIRKS